MFSRLFASNKMQNKIQFPLKTFTTINFKPKTQYSKYGFASSFCTFTFKGASTKSKLLGYNARSFCDNSNSEKISSTLEQKLEQKPVKTQNDELTLEQRFEKLKERLKQLESDKDLKQNSQQKCEQKFEQKFEQKNLMKDNKITIDSKLSLRETILAIGVCTVFIYGFFGILYLFFFEFLIPPFFLPAAIISIFGFVTYILS